jgi:hypothetical protein
MVISTDVVINAKIQLDNIFRYEQFLYEFLCSCANLIKTANKWMAVKVNSSLGVAPNQMATPISIEGSKLTV